VLKKSVRDAFGKTHGNLFGQQSIRQQQDAQGSEE
jgi:hypothetical protein